MTLLTPRLFGRLGLLLLLASPASAADDANPSPPTDQAVSAAIQKGLAYLHEQRKPEGHWEPDANTKQTHWGGSTALVLLSLLYAGEDPRGDDMQGSLDWLAGQQLNGTYTYGIRAHVLALVPGKRYRSRLEGDVKWIMDNMWPRSSQHPGCHGYVALTENEREPDALGYWDNSASQYGVLGLWMAAEEGGVSVPPETWEMILNHWLTTQRPDGGWSYRGDGDSTGSMTAAGLTTLFVILDQRYAANPMAASGLLSAVRSGLDWFRPRFTTTNPQGPSSWIYYYLYGIERVGRASGYRFFGPHDWFRAGAAYVLSQQQADGAWPGTGEGMDQVRNTALAVMFLCHGRAPLVYQKLEYGAGWDAHMRDVAGLTRYVGHTYERLVNWQIVNLEVEPSELLEAPVLYLYAKQRWELPDAAIQKLREYCQRGGLLFVVADAENPKDEKAAVALRESFEHMAQQMLPDLRVHPVPSDHPLLSGAAAYKIESPPPLLEVSNGVRTLLLYCGRDIAEAWARYDVRGRGLADVQLGTNVFVYATDKTIPETRLRNPTIARQPSAETRRTLELARIRHSGDWDIEPYGWTQMANYMQNQTGTLLLVTSGIRFDDEQLKQFKVAYLTGTKPLELSEEERKGLRRFLISGGTLLADAAMGSRPFAQSFEKTLRDLLQQEPTAVPATSFLVTGKGIDGAVDLSDVAYRHSARRLVTAEGLPTLRTFGTRQRYSVIYSPLDLSAGLLGTEIFGLAGPDADSTLRIMRNLLLYSGLTSAEKSRLQGDK